MTTCQFSSPVSCYACIPGMVQETNAATLTASLVAAAVNLAAVSRPGAPSVSHLLHNSLPLSATQIHVGSSSSCLSANGLGQAVSQFSHPLSQPPSTGIQFPASGQAATQQNGTGCCYQPLGIFSRM
ncbi:unnamed protein product [Protopolystoma xenopodis]|uniref:Uncharacterized protein n=1 Tax=Protopolystoma xenopodis TaxID=117903 RepID=A0A448XAV4_9PLAT|nr:unnamed protein product [Protopolystoma xenopodis]